MCEWRAWEFKPWLLSDGYTPDQLLCGVDFVFEKLQKQFSDIANSHPSSDVKIGVEGESVRQSNNHFVWWSLHCGHFWTSEVQLDTVRQLRLSWGFSLTVILKYCTEVKAFNSMYTWGWQKRSHLLWRYPVRSQSFSQVDLLLVVEEKSPKVIRIYPLVTRIDCSTFKLRLKFLCHLYRNHRNKQWNLYSEISQGTPNTKHKIPHN